MIKPVSSISNVREEVSVQQPERPLTAPLGENHSETIKRQVYHPESSIEVGHTDRNDAVTILITAYTASALGVGTESSADSNSTQLNTSLHKPRPRRTKIKSPYFSPPKKVTKTGSAKRSSNELPIDVVQERVSRLSASPVKVEIQAPQHGRNSAAFATEQVRTEADSVDVGALETAQEIKLKEPRLEDVSDSGLNPLLPKASAGIITATRSTHEHESSGTATIASIDPSVALPEVGPDPTKDYEGFLVYQKQKWKIQRQVRTHRQILGLARPEPISQIGDIPDFQTATLSTAQYKAETESDEAGGLSSTSKLKPRKTRAVKIKSLLKSPYFPCCESENKPKKKERGSSQSAEEKSPRKKGGTISCIPFPRLDTPHFGLLQEKLSNDPFKLLVGVTFLIRTHGRDAIPVFYELINLYPTAEALAAADKKDIIEMTRHLGLQVSRANTYFKYANGFINDPPAKDRRHRVENYPEIGCHKEIKKSEVLTDEDPRSGAWEIGHLTQGAYALDSWRMFCRDKLRGLATSYDGEGNSDPAFEPEWTRVLPKDKELRAWMRWRYLKEGLLWDPITGEKKSAPEDLLEAAREGKIAWDDEGGLRIVRDEEVESGCVRLVEGGGNSASTLAKFEELAAEDCRAERQKISGDEGGTSSESVESEESSVDLDLRKENSPDVAEMDSPSESEASAMEIEL